MRLREAGLRPFFDEWHLVPGKLRFTALEAAIAASPVVAVLIAPKGMAGWHDQERRPRALPVAMMSRPSMMSLMGATADGATLDELIDELGRVVREADEAGMLALRAGFPRADLPVFKTPRMFWSQVVQAADDGKVRGGVQALADEAAKEYPFNNFFANYPARTIADQQVESTQEQPTKSVSWAGRPDVAQPEDRATPYRPKVAHRVTERDRDLFVRSTFDTIRDYFQRGLSAMEGDYAGIEGDLERVSSREMRVKIYRDGDVAAECHIFLDALGMKNSIGFHWDPQRSSGNAINGWLSIHGDETPLGWSANMMGFGAGSSSKKLDQTEAAEQLWRQFVSPLERQPP